MPAWSTRASPARCADARSAGGRRRSRRSRPRRSWRRSRWPCAPGPGRRSRPRAPRRRQPHRSPARERRPVVSALQAVVPVPRVDHRPALRPWRAVRAARPDRRRAPGRAGDRGVDPERQRLGRPRPTARRPASALSVSRSGRPVSGFCVVTAQRPTLPFGFTTASPMRTRRPCHPSSSCVSRPVDPEFIRNRRPSTCRRCPVARPIRAQRGRAEQGGRAGAQAVSSQARVRAREREKSARRSPGDRLAPRAFRDADEELPCPRTAPSSEPSDRRPAPTTVVPSGKAPGRAPSAPRKSKLGTICCKAPSPLLFTSRPFSSTRKKPQSPGHSGLRQLALLELPEGEAFDRRDRDPGDAAAAHDARRYSPDGIAASSSPGGRSSPFGGASAGSTSACRDRQFASEGGVGGAPGQHAAGRAALVARAARRGRACVLGASVARSVVGASFSSTSSRGGTSRCSHWRGSRGRQGSRAR